MKDKKIITMIGIVLVIVVIAFFIIFTVNLNQKGKGNKEIKDVIMQGQDAVIFVQNSDSKDKDILKEIKKELKNREIEYFLYDTTDHTKEQYSELLQMLSINASDFNDPAIIYIKDGTLYSDIINIHKVSTVSEFINDNHLENIGNKKDSK